MEKRKNGKVEYHKKGRKDTKKQKKSGITKKQKKIKT